MATVRYSVRAERDLAVIAEYTLDRWGPNQALRYLDELEAKAHQLAASPSLGRPCDDIRPGLRRFEYAKHVIFYREHTGGILISRILHQAMLPKRQPIDDDDA